MRKWTETIKPWPHFKAESFYEVEVIDIRKIQKQIEVIIRILDKEMFGRTLSISLPLPIRPEGSTAEFFMACHITISPDTQISPRETIGRILYMKFKESEDKVTAISFKANTQQSHSGKEN